MKRGIYLLPSLFTILNIVAGFFSLHYSISLNFSAAAWAIFIAIIMDITDGRVARVMHAESSFGMELDSLADFLSFGVAPAFLMYQIHLKDMGKIGLAISAFFIITSALRLARFNSIAHQTKEISTHFEGLPTTAAGGIIASFVLSYELFKPFAEGQELTAKTIPLIMKRMPMFFKTMPFLMVLISIFLISKIRYSNFKKINFSHPHSFQLLVLLIVSIILIFIYPQNAIFLIYILYFLSGIVEYITRIFRLRKKKETITHPSTLSSPHRGEDER
ncbi:MAG: CDP-diacylglycerol--serine O-phosphatidyltransferase [Elusimicrobia bacterium]|nr:CDP-diacylglycerol--serine O-phosphatidyltransferase [Elusimicrobiota bacterium]